MSELFIDLELWLIVFWQHHTNVLNIRETFKGLHHCRSFSASL